MQLPKSIIVSFLAIAVLTNISLAQDGHPEETTLYKHMSQERLEIGDTVHLKGIIVSRSKNLLLACVVEGGMDEIIAVGTLYGESMPGMSPKYLTIVMPDSKHDFEEQVMFEFTGRFDGLNDTGTPVASLVLMDEIESF